MTDQRRAMMFVIGATVFLVAAWVPEVLWVDVHGDIPSQQDAVRTFLGYFPRALQQGSRIEVLQMTLAVASIVLAAMGRKGARAALRVKAAVVIVIAVLLLALKVFQAM